MCIKDFKTVNNNEIHSINKGLANCINVKFNEVHEINKGLANCEVLIMIMRYMSINKGLANCAVLIIIMRYMNINKQNTYKLH